MATAPLFNAAGDRVGEATLGDYLFGQPARVDLVHQAVERELANRRRGTHDTKSRSEVRGGGKKPFRQKGTGRARQGSTRAPHWRHGGIAHGPTPHEYKKDMPKKMRRVAFRSALSSKVTDGAVRVVEQLQISEISTKQFAQWLAKLEPEGRVMLVLREHDANVELSARNLPNVEVVLVGTQEAAEGRKVGPPGLSTYEVIRAETLVFTQDAVAELEKLEERYAA